jgi:ribosomal protein S18 acetylase RimI-like enzyme
MPEIVIASPAGAVRLRPERADDRDFRFALFCASRPPEWASLPFPAELLGQLMRQQFEAQTRGYAGQFPNGRFDIVELGGAAIGRIVTDRPGDRLHLVDIALMPQWRNRGIGTAILEALIAEAIAARVPVRLQVATSNDPSLRLYRRLGFEPLAQTPMHIEMERRTNTAEPG